jgi:chromosome partitioning protein
VLINRASAHPGVKEAGEAIELVKEFPCLQLLNTTVCERVAYRRAAVNGMTVTEYKPEDSKAIEEMRGLYNEIF